MSRVSVSVVVFLVTGCSRFCSRVAIVSTSAIECLERLVSKCFEWVVNLCVLADALASEVVNNVWFSCHWFFYYKIVRQLSRVFCGNEKLQNVTC